MNFLSARLRRAVVMLLLIACTQAAAGFSLVDPDRQDNDASVTTLRHAID